MWKSASLTRHCIVQLYWCPDVCLHALNYVVIFWSVKQSFEWSRQVWAGAVYTYEKSSPVLALPLPPHSPSFSLLSSSATLSSSFSWRCLSCCSSGNLRSRVRGPEGHLLEGGGGGERRPDDPDEVPRDNGHQRLPAWRQLQGQQEVVRDGPVGGRWHLRTN